MKIISIDPGFERVGIAVLEKNQKENLLFSECFKTKSSEKHEDRLFKIGQEIQKIIEGYKPEYLVIEKLFFNTNQKTIIGVAEARGVILYQASLNGLKISEFTPLQVKVAVTGYGRSEKKQVETMVCKILKIEPKKTSDDEFDAIALGLTFFAHFRV